MILMFSEKGGYMNCYNAKEVERAKSKGWTVVPDVPHIATKPQKPRKPRSDAGKTRAKK
jgi:hypothetical protein